MLPTPTKNHLIYIYLIALDFFEFFQYSSKFLDIFKNFPIKMVNRNRKSSKPNLLFILTEFFKTVVKKET